MKKYLVLTLLVVAIVVAVYSYPAAAACIVASDSPFSAPNAELLQKAKARITSKFGPMRSQPTVYFFDQNDTLWSTRINPYGSTSFLGFKTCVAIGPYGQNIDVVAHELMHAEIEERAGSWRRAREIPIWFDEGLAMQVDYREKYNFQTPQRTDDVMRLNSAREFFSTDGDTLTYNYTAAKSHVEAWLLRNSGTDIFESLARIKNGTSFDSVWQGRN